jgi:nucleotide-binding universal stress UspA family protein
VSGLVAGKPAHQGIDAPGTVSAWRFANDGAALAFSIVVTVSATHHDEGNAARVLSPARLTGQNLQHLTTVFSMPFAAPVAARRTTMASYRKILLCYDGSREGRKALRDGANLALDLKAETHVLAVVDMRSSIAQSAGLLTDMACGRFEDAARDILREGVEWLTERGVKAEGHFAFGHPIDEIAGLAQSLQVDLVVVGHRCRTGLARWWMGAGNTPLMDRVSCSILVAVSPTGTSAEQEDAAHAAMPAKAEANV